jgi:hypothetical protein
MVQVVFSALEYLILVSNAQNTTYTMTNSYGMFPERTICQASQALFPTSEQELVSMVASACRKKNQSQSCNPLFTQHTKIGMS